MKHDSSNVNLKKSIYSNLNFNLLFMQPKNNYFVSLASTDYACILFTSFSIFLESAAISLVKSEQFLVCVAVPIKVVCGSLSLVGSYARNWGREYLFSRWANMKFFLLIINRH